MEYDEYVHVQCHVYVHVVTGLQTNIQCICNYYIIINIIVIFSCLSSINSSATAGPLRRKFGVNVLCIYVCMYMCERERERGGRERERERRFTILMYVRPHVHAYTCHVIIMSSTTARLNGGEIAAVVVCVTVVFLVALVLLAGLAALIIKNSKDENKG